MRPGQGFESAVGSMVEGLGGCLAGTLWDGNECLNNNTRVSDVWAVWVPGMEAENENRPI
jgi:hypothetical protein